MKRIFFVLFMMCAASSIHLAKADESSLNVEAMGGYGFSGSYQTLLGGRGGYFFSNGIYLGTTYTHFFGSSSEGISIDSSTDTISITGPTTRNAVTGDLGYRIQLPQGFELTPYLGLGFMLTDIYSSTITGTSSTGSTEAQTRFLATPGLKLGYQISSLVVGIDSRYFVVPDQNSISLAGTVGIRF